MADDLNIRGSVDIQTSAARRAMNALAREIESYNKLTDKSSASARAQRAGIKQLTDTVNTLTQNLAKAEAAQKRLNAAAAGGSGTTPRAPQASTPVGDSALMVSDRAMAQSAKYRVDQQTELNAKKQQEAAINQRLEAESRAALNNARAATESVKQRVALENAAAAAARRTAEAHEQQSQSLNAMRYALYDVSRTAFVTAAALGALAVAPFAIAVSWQRDFANVQRTVGGTSKEIAQLRSDFVGLAQTIPESWEELTNIGTLAGQLGIAREQVAAFTGVVAKFSATTDVSTDAAATAFGRLDNILLDSSGNFEGLASSVLRVGVNSVATESQILKISTQIASTAKLAGFTADQVIGLSGALASLGVPPELSRGVVTRVFGQISRAISEGGTNLERFGQLAGVSGKEFATAWDSNAAGAFQDLLGGIKAEGPAAEQAIRNLGITSVRDVPILLRLANSGTVVADAFRDAAIGFKTATELGDQYGVIASTIDSKIKILGNTIQALGDAIGSGGLPILGDILDGINKRLADFTNFASTDAGKVIVSIGLITTALGALLALLVAIGARGIAGYAALITAFQGMSLSAGGATVSLGSMNAMLAATGPLGAKAAAAIRVLGVALKAASLIGLVLVLPDVFRWAEDAKDQLLGYENTVQAISKRIKNSEFLPTVQSNASAEGFNAWVRDITRSWQDLTGLGNTLEINNDIKKLDDQLAEVASSGNAQKLAAGIKAGLDATGLSMKEFLNIAPALKGALDEQGISWYQAADGSLTFKNAVGDVANTALPELTDAEQEAQGAMQDWLDTVAGADATFLDIKAIYDSQVEGIKKVAQETADGTDDAADSWQTYYDGVSINVDDYLANLQKQVDAQNNWEQNLLTLRSRGATDAVIDELTRLGSEGAPLVQSFVDGTIPQLDRFGQLLEEKGTEATTNFAVALQNASPEFWAAAAALGDGALTEITAKLASGETTVQQVISDYHLTGLDVPVTTSVDPETQAETQSKLDTVANPRQADYAAKVAEQDRLIAQFKLDTVANPRQADFNANVVPENANAAQAKLDGIKNPRQADYYTEVEPDSFQEARQRFYELQADRTVRFNIQVLGTEAARAAVSYAANSGSVGGIPGNTGGQIGALAGIPGFARGGTIPGPRQPNRRTDNILMFGRSHEFMMNEQASNYWGTDLLNAMNNRSIGTEDFMRPVPVAQRGNNGSGPQLVEFVASDKALLASRGGSGLAVVTFAPSEAAAAANKGNTSNFKKGGN